jgi:dTDP-glucose pyrophosphorylase/predicted transcriptional regulator
MVTPENRQIFIKVEDTLRRAIKFLDANRIQIIMVVDESRHLQGTVTDGDIRRGILRGLELDAAVGDVMNPNPVTAPVSMTKDELLVLMTSHSIKQVPLVDESGRVLGVELLDELLRSSSIKDNPVIILAGGQGVRLRPLTDDTPKPLLKVGDQPVLALILNQLRAYGFHRFFISVNYLGDRIEEYFGHGQKEGLTIEYLREREPLGTAGPLSLMPQPFNLPCIVVNGDLLTKINFAHMLQFHHDEGFQITIGVKQHPLQLPYGVVVTEGVRIVEFKEKPVENRLINAGVYVLDPEVVTMVPKDAYYDMNQLINQVLCRPEQRAGAFLIHEYWMDIGTAPDYQQAQTDYRTHFGE